MKKMSVMITIVILIFTSYSCNSQNPNSNINESEKEVQKTTSTASDTKKADKKAIKHLIEIRKENVNLDKLITTEQLKILDEEELALLRNAIFAKHGYTFRTKKYSEYFSKIEWYTPKFYDVNNLLTEIDKQNINNIVEIENEIKERKKPIKVFETVRQVTNKPYSYKVEFYLIKDLMPRDDVIFNQFLIYKIQDNKEILVFDSQKNANLPYEDILGDSTNDEHILRIEDLDGDGIEELYFDLQTFFGDSSTLIINYINNEYKVTFYGDLFDSDYKDLDNDGVKELLTYQITDGGGWRSIWVGLELVYKWDGKRYKFSYDLTRKLLEDQKNTSEILFVENPTPENFVQLLNDYADLGMSEETVELIKNHPELVNSDFDYSIYYDQEYTPDSTFFDFVIRRAKAYKIDWENMKTWTR